MAKKGGAIISAEPGKVHYIRLDNVDAVALITMYPGPDTFTAVITQFTLNQAVNVSFQRALQKSVYAYTFGDSMGDLQVSGIAFVRSCDNVSSLEATMDYYNERKMSSNLDPIQITFAGKVIQGYIVGCSFSSNDANSYSCQFQLDLKTAAPDVIK